ncbi:hypothetical protein [Actinomadura sp. HBU206391]|nr:hypothetical protein [Actinomadura sp. HBU206391]MBC6460309.1 hypothetical protein [Actinomadura sp. HBU206391]
MDARPASRNAIAPNRLQTVNRPPRWLLPAVLTVLILAVIIGSLLN